MKTLILVLGSIILGGCMSKTTEPVKSDTTVVKTVDSIKVDSLKK